MLGYSKLEDDEEDDEEESDKEDDDDPSHDRDESPTATASKGNIDVIVHLLIARMLF